MTGALAHANKANSGPLDGDRVVSACLEVNVSMDVRQDTWEGRMDMSLDGMFADMHRSIIR